MSEAELDRLLQDAFLSAAAADDKTVEAMSQYVFSDAVTLSPQSHNPSILRKLTGNNNRFFFLSLLFVLLAGSVFYFLVKKKDVQSQYAFYNTSVFQRISSPPPAGSNVSYNIAENSSPEIITEEPGSILLSAIDHTVTYDTSFIADKKRNGFAKSYQAYEDDDDGEGIPQLSDKEKKQHEREKAGLLAQMASKKSFGTEQSTDVDFEGEKVWATTRFRVFETSVHEYRIFLNDLIVTQRYADYRKALPDGGGWTRAGFPRQDSIYMNKGYNDFPVVNISREAAVMYCNWLTKEFTKAAGDDQIKSGTDGYVGFMLPTVAMWKDAAIGYDSLRQFPSFSTSDSIQNKLGCCLANFNLEKSKGKLRPLNEHCTSKTNKAINNQTSAGRAIDSLITCPVSSYNPNLKGIFCISGNVAEMAWDGGKAVALGGSWNSGCDDLKVNSPQRFENQTSPSAEIGFRIVRFETSKPVRPFTEKITYTSRLGSDSGKVKEAFVPLLTAKQISETAKQKKKMTREIVADMNGSKRSKGEYMYVPMGMVKMGGKQIPYRAFYLQKTEVTNLYYRSFLNDLIVQGRYEDYLAAKPDESVWLTVPSLGNAEFYYQLYFYHPAYDDYPVLNISRRAAEIYCRWLTAETQKEESSGIVSPANIEIRLPSETEWIAAARGGAEDAVYPWTGNYLRNSKGNYLCNFWPDTAYLASARTEGNEITVTSSAYNPNNYGLYNMSGNVAEMVTTEKSVKCKGGSWNDTADNVRIESVNEYEGEINPKPWIGFRPVIIYKVGKKE